eukprot:CAMPEP_0184481620 /NCGR_PEP_ID=MMETSP0113_2-20130426/3177_1 /TAXON_ID=91329 /ORGANISM="Norrisiella sphaerica, Strain BC52" /LENGTH=233 /DNA_ID=CAMNT_0026860847 /DNA_START=752 /DNA_END=1453 /DNA_ORIENTATION=-
MTFPLAEKAKSLTVIESDIGFMEATRAKIWQQYSSKTNFIHSDFTKIGFTKVAPERFVIVANLPYQISTSFIQNVISERRRVDKAIIMVQREFAERLAAPPGNKIYGSLSVFAQFYLNVKKLIDVPRTAFKPVPNVDSQVIEVIPREKPLYNLDEVLFFQLVRSAFWGRRKSLAKCIRQSPFLRKASVRTRPPSECDFFKDRPMIRGEELSISEFVRVYKELFLSSGDSPDER